MSLLPSIHWLFFQVGMCFVGSTEGVHRQKRGEQDWSLVGQWNLGRQCIFVASAGDERSTICTMTVLSDSTLLVGAGNQLFVTEDGEEWNCFEAGGGCVSFIDPLPGTSAPVEYLQSIGDGFLVAVGGGVCTFLVYDDIGFHPTGLAGGVYQYAMTDHSIIAAMKGAQSPSCRFKNGLYRSVDEGKSWASIPRDRVIHSVIAARDESWICVGTGGGVQCSEDEGLSWHVWNEGLTNAMAKILFPTKTGDLFAGVLGGARLGKEDESWDVFSLDGPESRCSKHS